MPRRRAYRPRREPPLTHRWRDRRTFAPSERDAAAREQGSKHPGTIEPLACKCGRAERDQHRQRAAGYRIGFTEIAGSIPPQREQLVSDMKEARHRDSGPARCGGPWKECDRRGARKRDRKAHRGYRPQPIGRVAFARHSRWHAGPRRRTRKRSPKLPVFAPRAALLMTSQFDRRYEENAEFPHPFLAARRSNASHSFCSAARYSASASSRNARREASRE
jgi:hypothetical protein